MRMLIHPRAPPFDDHVCKTNPCFAYASQLQSYIYVCETYYKRNHAELLSCCLCYMLEALR